MIVRNKKNGSNVLAYREGIQVVKINIRAGEQVEIKDLNDFEQIVNKADFLARGWFEIIDESKGDVNEDKVVEFIEEVIEYRITDNEVIAETIIVVDKVIETPEIKTTSSLEKAKKEMKDYTKKNKNN